MAISVSETLGLAVVIEGFSQFMSQMGQMDNAIGKTADAWSNSGGVIGTALGGMAEIGTAALKGIALAAGAVGAALVGTIEPAMNFQDAIIGLSLAAGNSGASMDSLHDAAIAVGNDSTLIGVSASGAADAMTNLYKAGLDTGEIFGDLNGYLNGTAELGGALRASIDLAAASELDIGQASTLAAQTLAVFGGELQTAEERSNFVNAAMNNIVKTADASVASVSSLSEALGYVGPTAAAAGYSIEDTNTALGILSMAGIEGSRAGTNLDAMLRSLQAPTKEASTTLKELGINLYDANGQFLPLPAIIQQFETSLKGATDQERDLALNNIFTANGMRSMNVLLQSGTKGWEDMSVAVGNASGISAQSEKRAQSLSMRFETLAGMIETLRIGIGESLLPVLTILVEKFSGLVETYGPMLVDTFSKIAGGVGGFIEDLLNGQNPMLAFIEMVAGLFPESVAIQIITVAGQIRDFATAVWTAIEPVVTWLSQNVELQDVLIALGAAMAIAAAVIVGPLIAGFLQLTAIFAAVVGAIALLRGAWESDFGGIRTAFTDFWNGVSLPILTAMYEWLAVNVPLALQTLAGFWINTLWPAIQTVATWWVSTLMPIVIELWQWLMTNLPVALQALSQFWTGVLLPALQAVWAFIESNVIPIIVALYEMMAKLPETIQIWQTNFENLKTIIGMVWQGIVDSITSAWDSIVSTFNENLQTVQDLFTNFSWSELGQGIVDGIANGIASGASAIANAASNAASAALDAAKGVLGIHSPSTAFAWVGEQAMAGYAQGIRDAAPMVQSQVVQTVTPPTVTNVNNVNNYNLTTNSMVRPGGLALEFSSMQTGSR